MLEKISFSSFRRFVHHRRRQRHGRRLHVECPEQELPGELRQLGSSRQEVPELGRNNGRRPHQIERHL
jgi:hypothetical protein